MHLVLHYTAGKLIIIYCLQHKEFQISSFCYCGEDHAICKFETNMNDPEMVPILANIRKLFNSNLTESGCRHVPSQFSISSNQLPKAVTLTCSLKIYQMAEQRKWVPFIFRETLKISWGRLPAIVTATRYQRISEHSDLRLFIVNIDFNCSVGV